VVQFSIEEQVFNRNMERFLGELVVTAHKLFYHPTLGSRAIKEKKKVGGTVGWGGISVSISAIRSSQAREIESRNPFSCSTSNCFWVSGFEFRVLTPRRLQGLGLSLGVRTVGVEAGD
jgi:hypothetical protein